MRDRYEKSGKKDKNDAEAEEWLKILKLMIR